MLSKDRRKKNVVESLKRDPYFDGDAEAQAEVILKGLGNCSQCCGWGCSYCYWSGEEPFPFYGKKAKGE